MSANGLALQLDHVGKTFGSGRSKKLVLEDINFDVVEQEFVCLLGESGCGKSTLLQLMAGFERPTTGKMLYRGTEIRRPDPRRGVVFQDESLLPWLTLERNISLGLEIRGQTRGRAARVTEFVRLMGLQGFERHYPAELSGGMAQRVAIARALINDANLLLLDEPFGALDAFTRMRLQSELLRIWERERLTIVFVTHDIEEAVFLGTRLILMSAKPGRIARTFNISLAYPRDRTSPEFIRLRSMITKEFLAITQKEI